MRATRDRRRRPLARQRAELLAHVQQTNNQDNLPALGHKSAYQANRAGGAERCADPAVPKRIEVDLALITSDEALLREVERSLRNMANHQDATTRALLQTVPGIGTILSRVWRYAIHALTRFPTVQEVASSGRLVT